MKKEILISAILITIATISFADTHIPAGNVNGTWTYANSPYVIDGEIYIDTLDTLTIEPEVEVFFSGHYKFNIYGRLLAEGTENDTIILTAQDTTVGWHSLRFCDTNTNGQDSSRIVYCKLEYGKAIGGYPDNSGGAIYCYNSSDLFISNCIITKNTADYYGGGIFCNQSSPILKNINIVDNHVYYDDSVYVYYGGNGGGICCYSNSNPSISNVTVSDNSAFYINGKGGGICCLYNSSPNLNNVIIKDNSAMNGGGIFISYNSCPNLNNVIIRSNTATYIDGHGGGIFCYSYSNPSLINVIIEKNTAQGNGGGILCGWYSSPNITNVIINDNIAYSWNTGSGGGGICCSHSSPNLINVTLCNNIVENSYNNGGGIFCGYDSNLDLVNSILWNNSPQEIYIESGSVTATYSDIQGGWSGTGNIDADPLFADPENGDFHLTWTNFPIPDSTMSPCIDTGDPNSPLDPDSTRADMGAYYFDQTQTEVGNTSVLQARFLLYQNYPNPFNPKTKIQYSIPKDARVELKIYNIKGQLVKTLFNQKQKRGIYTLIWDGKDNKGRCVGTGVYLYQLKAGNNSTIKKMILLK